MGNSLNNLTRTLNKRKSNNNKTLIKETNFRKLNK